MCNKYSRIHIERGPLSLSPPLFLSVSLPILFLSLAVSVLSYPPTLPLSLSVSFRASLSPSQSQFGISPRSRAGEVTGKKKKSAALLADVSHTVSNTSQSTAADEARRHLSSYTICVLYQYMGPFERSPGLASVVFKTISDYCCGSCCLIILPFVFRLVCTLVLHAHAHSMIENLLLYMSFLFSSS